MARSGARPQRSHGKVAGGAGEGAVARHLAAGLERHRAGDLAGAAEHFRRAVALDPNNADALHLLGVVHHLARDSQAAIGLLRKAAELSPRNAEIRSNLGAALLAAGDSATAVEALRIAAIFDPNRAETHGNLAAALSRLGQTDAAIESLETAQRLSPTTPRFVRRLAELNLDSDRLGEALAWFAHYLALSPNDADAHNNAAYACERLGRLNDAAAYYQSALERRPDSPEIANNLGSVLKRLGRIAEADQLFERALSAPPERWEDEAHRAGLLHNRRRTDEALALYEVLATRRPNDTRLLTDYAQALLAADRTAEAEGLFRRVLAAKPDKIEARVSLGHCLVRQMRAAEAIEVIREAADAAPHSVRAALALCGAFSADNRWDEAAAAGRHAARLADFRPPMFAVPHRAFRMTCAFDDIESLDVTLASLGSDGIDAAIVSSGFLHCLVLADDDAEIEHMAALHRRWGEATMAAAAADPLPPATGPRRPGRIRLGFLSSDLYSHSVGRFVLPLIERYDRERFEVVCYATHAMPKDRVQQAIRDQVNAFRIVGDQGHRDLAATIRGDAIDILFDLNGFTGESRLKALAYRPAPVQVYWLGYPFTTGLPAVDYILLDPNVVPTRTDWLVEKPLLMPDCWVCYDPFQEVPVASALPADRNGHVTFGSLNNPYKITRDAVALWARVMRAVPGSRFRYVRAECASAELRRNLTAEFARHGVGDDRLTFENNRAAGRSHFDCYGDIDLSLDTFPLTGGTTTIDALWMGIPVVTLVGPSLHQRLSRSLLHAAGLADLCTETRDDFVSRAVALAADTDRLRALRRSLRSRLLETPLGDRKTFARQFCDLMTTVAERHGLR